MTERNRLLPREWCAVTVLLGFLFSSGIIFFFSGNGEISKDVEEGIAYRAMISVTVEGAVESPGKYSILRGTTVAELLDKVVVLDGADYSKVRMESTLRDHQRIRIPFVDNVIVIVEGAVDKQGIVIVPRGTRLCDMWRYVKVSKNVDMEQLKRKRRVKDFEVIMFHANK